MDHKLKVHVRLDIDHSTASVEVCGCLTEASCGALLAIVRRVRNFAGGLTVIVDLRKSRHVETAALERLEWTSGALLADRRIARSGEQCFLRIQMPDAEPECPALRRLRSAEAAIARQDAVRQNTARQDTARHEAARQDTAHRLREPELAGVG